MTEFFYIIAFILFGIFVGFMSGAMGIGGGVIMVPVFMLFFELHGLSAESTHFYAIGTSLFAAFIASVSGTIRHVKNKNVNFRYGSIFALFAAVSSAVLSNVAFTISTSTLKIIFIIVLVIIALRMLFENNKIKNQEAKNNLIWLWGSPVFGAIIGMLSAFTGIGGGVLAVPVFHYIFKFEFKKAIGTSSFVIIFSVLAALIAYSTVGKEIASVERYSIGFVNLLVGIPTGLGAIFSAKYGADFAHTAKTKILKYIFSVLILITIVKIIFELLK